MFKITVLQSTSERLEPNIYSQKSGVVYEPGISWLTEVVYKDNPYETWVQTPNGNWTAAEFPVNNDINNIKVYATIESIPQQPAGHYDPTDVFYHEVNGVRVGEYHRWLP